MIHIALQKKISILLNVVKIMCSKLDIVLSNIEKY